MGRSLLTYKALYRQDEGGVHAELVDFPGVCSCGDDLEHARHMIRSALVDMAETMILEGQTLPLPNPQAETPEADYVEPVPLVLRSGRCVGATAIESRGELVRHIVRLVDEYRMDGEHWENHDLPGFLEAMSAWLCDCDGMYRNLGLPLDPSRPSWQLFADALSAAVVYE